MSRELNPLRKILLRAVTAARLSPHAVAEALGISVRAWERILSGKQILYVPHLLALARLLGVPPEDFLEIGLPEASRTAELRLSDWIDPAAPAHSPTAPATPAAPDDWQARIRDAVRRELDAAENG
jgi:transcriptional regulator with XRE-family HTH domain